MEGIDQDQDHSSSDISSEDSNGTTEDSKLEFSEDSKLEFSEDEEELIARMFRLVGERWSLIAGRIPGRTAEEIEKYWTSKYSSSSTDESTTVISNAEEQKLLDTSTSLS